MRIRRFMWLMYQEHDTAAEVFMTVSKNDSELQPNPQMRKTESLF